MFKKKILLVDDEPEFVEMIQMRLEANDYEVITAYDGVSGLEKAETERPDLILLDIMMPGMDGFAVLKELRRHEETRRMNVVMLTAKGQTKSIMQAQETGVTDYLTKPCETQDLLDICKRYA